MTGPDGIKAAACLVLVVDEAVSAEDWRAQLSPGIEVRTLAPEASDGADIASVIAGWPADRPWALLASGAAAPGIVARAAEAEPAPSRVFVGSTGGVLADPAGPPLGRPVTVVLPEDAADEERVRATYWAAAGEHSGGLVVRLVPPGQEPPAACHPHLAQGVREDLSLP